GTTRRTSISAPSRTSSDCARSAAPPYSSAWPWTAITNTGWAVACGRTCLVKSASIALPGRADNPLTSGGRKTMKASLIALLTLLLALPAWAERKHSFGEYDVHYIAFNSGFLQPDIAAAAGLVRSKSQGVLNVSVLKAGKPTMALVSGTVKNLLGQDRP